MGRARVACAGACTCAADVLDGHDIKDGVSVTDVRRVALRPARPAAAAGGCCRVALRIAQGTSSSEHKFKVMSLLLGSSDAHKLQVFSLRVAASASEGPAPALARGGGRRRGRGGGRRAARAARREAAA